MGNVLNVCGPTTPTVIGIIGATGSQGGSLARALLQDKKFSVRPLTRDPSKDAAQKLKEAGADVVAFDLDKPETFGPALEGLTGLFVVTNYWEHFSPKKELDHVKVIVEAGEKAGVKHFVWSTLEETS